MRLYSLIGDHRDFSIEGNTLVIRARDATYLQFSDAETLSMIERFLREDGDELTVKVVQAADDNAMDSAIDKLKKMMGDAKLEITK